MKRRPLCVALGMYILLILIVRGNTDTDRDPRYRGEQKTVQCQVEGIAGQGGSLSLVACDVVEDGKPFCRRMKLYQGWGGADFADIKIGNILLVTGKIDSFSLPGNPGQFNEYQYYQDQGISYRMSVQSLTVTDNDCKITEQWLCDVRTALYKKIVACLPEEEAGVAAAMVLGEKSALTEETRMLYQESGIAHLLAISGVKMLSLVSHYPLKKPVNWAFMRLHIAESYIISEGFSRRISSHCPSWDRGDKSLENNLAKVSIISQKLYCSAKEK